MVVGRSARSQTELETQNGHGVLLNDATVKNILKTLK